MRMSTIKFNTDRICFGHLASNAQSYKKTANQSARTIVAIYKRVLGLHFGETTRGRKFGSKERNNLISYVPNRGKAISY